MYDRKGDKMSGIDIISYKLGQKSVGGGAGGGGGGNSSELRYVTFMSHDGTVELGKKAVAVGDDCADPIARGIFDTPTKESTAQYNYSFVGWATTPDGAWDETALDAVSEDRTVYAAYAAALRYYTITYYDADGTTVLKTQTLAYGAMPSYTPTKENYLFVEWSPTLATVTGNASYTAVWEEKVTFATASWTKIGEICAAGNAANVFAVGDYRPITLTYKDGTTETINFRIVGMGQDYDADKNPISITCMADNLVKDYITPASAYNKGAYPFCSMDNIAAKLSELLSALPTDLQGIIKNKFHDENGFTGAITVLPKIFIPSRMGIFGVKSNFLNPPYPTSRYQYFAAGHSVKCTTLSDTTKDEYWLSSAKNRIDSNYSTYYYDIVDGTSVPSSNDDPTSKSYGIRMCFCI